MRSIHMDYLILSTDLYRCAELVRKGLPRPLSLEGKINKQRNTQGCMRKTALALHLSTAATRDSQGWLYRGTLRPCMSVWEPPFWGSHLSTVTTALKTAAENPGLTSKSHTCHHPAWHRQLWPRSPFPLWILTLAWQPQIFHYFKLTKLEPLSEG